MVRTFAPALGFGVVLAVLVAAAINLLDLAGWISWALYLAAVAAITLYAHRDSLHRAAASKHRPGQPYPLLSCVRA